MGENPLSGWRVLLPLPRHFNKLYQSNKKQTLGYHLQRVSGKQPKLQMYSKSFKLPICISFTSSLKTAEKDFTHFKFANVNSILQGYTCEVQGRKQALLWLVQKYMS